MCLAALQSVCPPPFSIFGLTHSSSHALTDGDNNGACFCVPTHRPVCSLLDPLANTSKTSQIHNRSLPAAALVIMTGLDYGREKSISL